MATDKTQAIKKHITRGTTGAHPLYVNEYDGEMWATDRYWLTRASRVAPLLEKFNLPADQPGAYEVNGTVRRATGSEYGIATVPPDLASWVKDQRDYQAGVRVRVAGHPAYVMSGTGTVAAVYALEDGSHAYLQSDDLDWLSELQHDDLPDGYRYGGVRVLFHRNAQGGIIAMIRADVIRVTERAHYTDKVEGQAQEYVPAVEEPAEPRLLGLMMGIKLDG
jgi:hypothetical protein